MKKILAILLSTAMLVAMLAVMALPTSAAALALDGTFDKASSGNDVSWFATEAYSGVEWRYATSFKPGVDAGTFEVVAMANPDGTSAGVAPLDVPEGGFVYITGPWGNDTNGKAIFAALSVGSIVRITGLDLTNKTVADDATLEVIGAKPMYDVEGNVAYKKSYTTSALYRAGSDWNHDPSANPSYPDEDGASLTDGVLPTERAYTDKAWAGLHDGIEDAAEAGFSWVEVDLAGEYSLNKIVAYLPPNLGDGVTSPSWAAFVAIAADGTETVVAEFDAEDFDTASNNAYLEVSATCDVVAAKVAIRMARGGYTFISEVAAYGVEYVANESSEDESSTEDTSSEDTSSEDTSSEDTSSEDTSSEDTSSEDTSSEDTSSEDTSDDDEITIEDLMGPVNEDAGFTVDVIAPETYVAGETFSVQFVINDITLAEGFDTFEFIVDFDDTKLELAEELSGSAVKVFDGFAEWEDLSKYAEGVLSLTAGTAGGENGDTFTFAKEDGEISFTVDFTAKADATGDALIYVCNECPMAYYTDGGVEAAGNGDYAIIAEGVAEPDPTEDEPVEPTPDDPKPGDSSSMIFFAVIALVAIAGSAVVIKARR